MKHAIPPRRANRLLNPGCIALVTATYRGRSNFMPAAWVVPLSHEPPLSGVAIAPKRFTHDLVANSGQFALCVPGLDLLDKVRYAGDISGRDVPDKFATVGLTPVPAQRIDAPVIAECLGHVECEVANRIQVGDHTFFIGLVVAAQAEETAFGETWLLPEDESLRPLHHLTGSYFSVLTRVIESSLQ